MSRVYPTTTRRAAAPRSPGRDARRARRRRANPSSAHREGARARAPGRGGARRGGGARRAARRRRSSSPAARPRPTTWRSAASGGRGRDRHHGDRARLGARDGAGPRRRGVTESAWTATGGSTPSDVVAACDDAAGARERRARQRRGRQRRADRGDRRGAAREGHRRATPTPHRPPVACRSTCARLGVDSLSLSSHKLGRPGGRGRALGPPRRRRSTAQSTGGPQERGRRAGTENVAALVGFGVAARGSRASSCRCGGAAARGARRSVSGRGSAARFPDVVRNGPATGPRLPNTLNVGVPGRAPARACSSSSTSPASPCRSARPARPARAEPSHVLRAMGRDADGRARRPPPQPRARHRPPPTSTAVLELLPRLVAAGARAEPRHDARARRGRDERRRRQRGRRRPLRRRRLRRRRRLAAARAATAAGAAARSTTSTTRRAVADRLGIPHYVFDFRDVFERARGASRSSPSTSRAARRTRARSATST